MWYSVEKAKTRNVADDQGMNISKGNVNIIQQENIRHLQKNKEIYFKYQKSKPLIDNTIRTHSII